MSDFLAIQKFLLVNQKSELTNSEENKPIDLEVTAVDMDQIDHFEELSSYSPSITPGYFLFSTAPFYTEQSNADLIVDTTPAMKAWMKAEKNKNEKYKKSQLIIRNISPEKKKDGFLEAINSIASDLIENRNSMKTSELIIAIHGYSTEQTSVRRWYKRIFNYVNQNSALEGKKNLVFVGYRWSSEQPDLSFKNIGIVLKALPAPLQALPLIPLAFFSIALLAVFAFKWLSVLPVLLILLVLSTVSALSVVASLVILRIIVYFRDSYRANHFAVPDLVEFIRQLNQAIAIAAKNIPDLNDQLEQAPNFKVNLSFIAHSMGGFVATSAIRILSDVFDSDAVEQKPSSQIGQYLCLKRLILVSPDIPKLAIDTSRANFLASALRRFDEAYLFSNEADLALRLASTAANYFSFPANTRKSGYRLGNVTINPDKCDKFGIVNLKSLADTKKQFSEDENCWFDWFNSIARSEAGPAINSLFESYSGSSSPSQNSATEKDLTIADLFTYFDCTDYIEAFDISTSLKDQLNKFPGDTKDRYFKFIRTIKLDGEKVPVLGVLSRAKNAVRRKPKILNFVDHTFHTVDYLLGRDVHGGYFSAPFTQDLIYQLAFLGLSEMLNSSYKSGLKTSLEVLSERCDQYKLQVLLSPLHYQAACTDQEEKSKITRLEDIKVKLLEYIKSLQDKKEILEYIKSLQDEQELIEYIKSLQNKQELLEYIKSLQDEQELLEYIKSLQKDEQELKRLVE